MYHLLAGGLNCAKVPKEFTWETNRSTPNAIWYRLLFVEQMEKVAIRDVIEIDVQSNTY